RCQPGSIDVTPNGEKISCSHLVKYIERTRQGCLPLSMPPHRHPIDPLLLATLVAVAETGSFARAADRIGRTAGRGARLSARSGRGITLTPRGEALVAHPPAYPRLLRAGSCHAGDNEPIGPGAFRRAGGLCRLAHAARAAAVCHDPSGGRGPASRA